MLIDCNMPPTQRLVPKRKKPASRLSQKTNVTQKVIQNVIIQLAEKKKKRKRRRKRKAQPVSVIQPGLSAFPQIRYLPTPLAPENRESRSADANIVGGSRDITDEQRRTLSEIMIQRAMEKVEPTPRPEPEEQEEPDPPVAAAGRRQELSRAEWREKLRLGVTRTEVGKIGSNEFKQFAKAAGYTIEPYERYNKSDSRRTVLAAEIFNSVPARGKLTIA